MIKTGLECIKLIKNEEKMLKIRVSWFEISQKFIKNCWKCVENEHKQIEKKLIKNHKLI